MGMAYKSFKKTIKALQKTVVLFLVFVFFITPLAPVFAEVLDSTPAF